MDRTPTLIAHRGWSSRFPENSVPGIAAAISVGADEVEIDLRASRDGIVFVLHDATLDRVSSLTGPVSDLDSSEILRGHTRGMDGADLSGLRIPTFREVFQTFGHLTTFNIHIKESNQMETVLDEVRACLDSGGHGRHYIASDAGTLEAARKHVPGVELCLVSQRTEPVGPMLERAHAIGCDRVQFFVGNCTPDDVGAAKRLGLVTNYYFADTEEDARELMSWGIDALLTNDIGGVYEVLGA